MAIRVEKRDGTGERTVLTTMMVSRAVLGAVAARWEPPGLFSSRWANLAGGWAVQHYRKYGKAPNRTIQGYFDAWAETGKDRDTVQLLDSFLSGLSEEYERLKKSVSPDYVLDLASKLFNRVRIAQLREQLEVDLQDGDIDKAMSRIENHRRLEIGSGSGVDVLGDETAMSTAFEQRGEVLVSYPGALENFFGPALGRDQFVSFMGKEKVGKSFWLQDVAVRAIEQERNVAYFECGDSSQHQVLRRLAARIAEHPVDPGKYYRPTSIEPGVVAGLPELGTELLEFPEGLTAERATKAFARLGEKVGRDRLKLSCHPNSSLSVHGAAAIIDGWERDGWRPDVVVFDYADILAPLDGRADTRDQINATWKALRALSQKLHCLVITATQTDADSYDAKILTRGNFSEDKRKYAHVTGMVGINQTPPEKEVGLYRLNWVVLRELEFAEEKCVWTASCLPLCNPCVLSTF